MPRAVRSSHSLLIHLLPDTGCKTSCGIKPVAKADPTIRRLNMCKICFGKKVWTAQEIEVERIVE